MINGQAGVGKSEVLRRIISELKSCGRKVGVICSSGIACQVYDRLLPSTVQFSRSRLGRLIKVLWYECFLLMKRHIVDNADEVIVTFGRKGFTEATSMSHEFFIGKNFLQYICSDFDVPHSTPPQRAVVVERAKTIYWQFLERLTSLVWYLLP